MPPKPWPKLRPKGRGLSNKECCPPSSSIRTKSLATADDDPQDTLKNVLSEDQDEALCALEKLAEPALRQLDIFRRNLYEPGFLHLPILRKALKKKSIKWGVCSSWPAATSYRDGCSLHIPPSPKPHVYWPPLLTSWEQSSELPERPSPMLQSSEGSNKFSISFLDWLLINFFINSS